jgi:hypothetical protein
VTYHDVPQDPGGTAILEYYIVGRQGIVQHGCLFVLQDYTVAVYQTFWLPCGAAGIEDIEWMGEGESLEFEAVLFP